MKTTNKIVKIIAKLAYPDYTGRKFFIEKWDGKEIDITSYWFEGSREYYTFIRKDGKMFTPPNTAPWKQENDENRNAMLVPGLMLVRRSIFCGHECGVTVIVHEEDFPKVIEYK